MSQEQNNSELKKTINYAEYKNNLAELFKYAETFETTDDLFKDVTETDQLDENGKKSLILELSNIYLIRTEYLKAIRLQSKVSSPEELKNTWYKVITALEDQKDFGIVEDLYSEIIKSDPNESRAYLGRAVAKLINTKPNAYDDLDMASENAKDEDEKLKVGLIYLQVEQLDKAKVCFEDILKTIPNHLEANLYLASIEQSQNKFSESQDRLQRLIELYPEEPDTYIQLGNLLLINKNADEALSVFEKVSKLVENSYISYALAICNLEKTDKDNQTALTHLEKAMELEPDNKTVRNLYQSLKVRNL